METVNIVCIKWGTKFGTEYVNKLYHMMKRNITLPFRFICMTEISEGIEQGIEVWDLPEFNEPPDEVLRKCLCWRKLAVFGESYKDIKGKVLLVDLDIVVIDNIDCFFTYSDKLTMAENWSKPGQMIGQGSVIGFEMGKYPHLLQQWEKDQASVYNAYETEQVYLSQALGTKDSTWYPTGWVIGFKDHCMPGGMLNSIITPSEKKIPKESKIIAFHGNPNPPQAIEGSWGEDVPWHKRLYKTVKPTPWITKYWS